MKVYARDYYCDELYGETDNWCITDYECELKHGEIDLEELVKAMIDEDWLGDDYDYTDLRVEEKDDLYVVYFHTEALFKIYKHDDD